jgi:predicted aconitase with swiveling domain
MRAKVFDCHKISQGHAIGKVLVSKDDICFYMVDPETGIVIEKGHALEGRSVADKVLVFPTGKGSSVVQADGLYQLQLRNNAPKAMIIQYADTVLVASAIVIGIPMVNKLPEAFYRELEADCLVEIDADANRVTIKASSCGECS